MQIIMQKIEAIGISRRPAMAKLNPSNASKKLLLRRLLGGVAALLIGLIVLAMQSNILQINQIHIEGNFKQLDKNHLEKLVMSEAQNGFFSVNLHRMRDSLLALPWVKTAAVYKIWPDQIKIVIHEQVAFARWGNDGFLNEQGDYFQAGEFTAPELQNLALLQGIQEQQKILFGYLKQLTQTYKLNVVRLCMGMQCPLEFELDSGLIVRLDGKDFATQIKRFSNIFIGMQEKLLQAKKIDMRYPNGFAVEWKTNQSGK